MTYLEEIKQLTQNGDLEITYIDHLPRTISHAFKRCLFEVFDTQSNEPFFDKEYSGKEESFAGLEKGCESILAAYEAAVAEGKEKPITLLVKDVAKSIPASALPDWLDAVTNVITLVRDPHDQAYSLLEAIAKDHVQKGDAKVSQEEVLGRVGGLASKMLEKRGGKQMLATSWQPMLDHIQTLDGYMEQHPKKNHVIVETSLLRLAPEEIMQEVIDHIPHVSFQESMLTCWEKSRDGFKQERDWGRSAIVGEDGTKRNNWTNNAFATEGFTLPDKPSVPLSAFPNEMQGHITDIALPAYAICASHAKRVGPKKLSQIKRYIETAVDKEHMTRFVDAHPTSAYMLVSGAAEVGDEQQRMIEDIRQHHPEHTASFDRIDTISHAIPSHRVTPAEHRPLSPQENLSIVG